MPKLYLPEPWFSPAMGVLTTAENRATVGGHRFRQSADYSLEERRDISEKYLGRFPPTQKKKRTRQVDPITLKITTEVDTVTVEPYILPTPIRTHPLNRHVYTEAGELREKKEHQRLNGKGEIVTFYGWDDPPTEVNGRDPTQRVPFAPTRKSATLLTAHDGAMMEQARMMSEAEQPAQAALDEKIDEALEAAESKSTNSDYDPHEEQKPVRRNPRDPRQRRAS